MPEGTWATGSEAMLTKTHLQSTGFSEAVPAGDFDPNLEEGCVDPNLEVSSRQARGGNFQIEEVNLIMDLKQEVKHLKRMLSEALTLLRPEVKKRAGEFPPKKSLKFILPTTKEWRKEPGMGPDKLLTGLG
ncbi:hypothetical protein NDU88_004244 [Pleurodeles waltl]|uniref:Uncharacterized protein n=1 Tax=Pleurodeles waltl TaxID=8319 RepID=A0AAV7SI78_PLEWA|nr:hypothetical protein NDU88_004244 [Pleurodeles waltl]